MKVRRLQRHRMMFAKPDYFFSQFTAEQLSLYAEALEVYADKERFDAWWSGSIHAEPTLARLKIREGLCAYAGLYFESQGGCGVKWRGGPHGLSGALWRAMLSAGDPCARIVDYWRDPRGRTTGRIRMAVEVAAWIREWPLANPEMFRLAKAPPF
jgi:hypothetical protein